MKIRKTKEIVERLELVNMEDYPDYLVKGLTPIEKFQSNWTPTRRDTWKKSASQYLKVMIACGSDREVCKDVLGINDQMYDAIEALLMENDAMKYCSMSVPQRYYVYAIQMEALVGQLNDYIKVNQHNDKANIVGAVKSIAQFRKEVIKTGQDLNVIDTKAKTQNYLGEVNLAALATDELKKLMQERMESFNNIIDASFELSGPYEHILSKSIKQLPDEVETVEDDDDDDDDDEDFLE